MPDLLNNFFISYNSTDRLWAEWIAWQLESVGYSIVLEAENYQHGFNGVQNMLKNIEHAECTIVVLSPNYLDMLFNQPQFASALEEGRVGKQKILLPVHVRESRYKQKNLSALIPNIDLVQLDETAAREKLLEEVSRKRSKLTSAPEYPGRSDRLIREQPRFPEAFPSYWNVPYQRNPFFTGREDILKRLYKALKADKTGTSLQPQAISGLDGIGKTQVAIEYAYRYHYQYQAILWVKAHSYKVLVADFVNIAHLLNLPEKDSQNQSRVVNAVKHWLHYHPDWLLILDDANDLLMARNFLPLTGRGHILLTTHTQAMGRMAQHIRLDKLEPREGAFFLLRRAKFISIDTYFSKSSHDEYRKAEKISQVLGGLPLALNEAGAYIEETACGLDGYLERYQKLGITLLKRQKSLLLNHMESVIDTWLASFEKVRESGQAATELLHLCAFLYPDAIPEEIIVDGAPDLGRILQSVAADPFELDNAIEELRKYSLVHRNPQDKILSIHCLVQAVLKDRMRPEIQQLWAERTVRAINWIFPEVEFTTWTLCQRYLSQAQECAKLIKQWNMAFPEAARLLHQAAFYSWLQAQYDLAEMLYEQALAIQTKIFEPTHPDVIQTLHNQALLYRTLGKYAEAESLFKQVLSIREHTLLSNDPYIAASLHELGSLYRALGRYVQAESFFKRALAIREDTLSPEHADMATSLNELGWLYRVQGKYTEAESLFIQALAIREQTLGSDHPDFAQTLNDLAWLYYDQGKYSEAEPRHQYALKIRERAFGSKHPDVAQTLNNLAWIYHIQGKYDQAKHYYKRALAIRNQKLGLEHPHVAQTLDNLGSLYYHLGDYAKAERHYKRALKIREHAFGSNHIEVSHTLNNLALLYHVLGRNDKAEPLFRQSLAIREQTLGPEHPHVANCLDNLGELYRTESKYGLADRYYKRALHIRIQSLGTEHPLVAQTLTNLAQLYHMQGKDDEAESFFKQSLAIREQTLGPEHPHVASSLNNLAKSYSARGEYARAEPLYQRALLIREKLLEPDHPLLAAVLENYAVLLRKTNQEIKAVELETRAKNIRAKYAQKNSMHQEA